MSFFDIVDWRLLSYIVNKVMLVSSVLTTIVSDEIGERWHWGVGLLGKFIFTIPTLDAIQNFLLFGRYNLCSSGHTRKWSDADSVDGSQHSSQTRDNPNVLNV